MDKNILTIHLRPLPPLQPLKPPSGMMDLFQDQMQVPSLSLSAVPEQQHEDEQPNTYKQLYEQKCEHQITLISRIKNHEQINKILKEKNAALEIQVTKLQEQKWKRFDYSRLSARGRSKSQKRVAPTIDVKVPHRMNQNGQILIQQEKYIKTERDSYKEDVQYYKQQIRQYRQENKKLKDQIEHLNKILKELPKADQSMATSIHNRSKVSRSPQKVDWRNLDVSTPVVSQFSPFAKQSQTVKKEMHGNEEIQFQLKKIKNQVLYKDLLLDKLRAQHKKQNQFLRKHLALSVTQSQKIAQQTTNILNSFKAQIIRLTHELMHYKRLLPNIQFQRKSNNLEKTCSESEFISILRTRRQQQISH